MKRRPRTAAANLKEPSSDLSDIDLSADSDLEISAAEAAGRRQKRAKPTQQSKTTAASQNAEESKGKAFQGQSYGRCQSLRNIQPSFKLDPKKMHRVILWMRNDLRLHDNPVLHWVSQQPAVKKLEILPVYSFDPRFNQRQCEKYRIRKTGIWRTRFQLESVQNFRQSLSGIGSGLLVTHQNPETFLSQLIKPEWQTTLVYQAETSEEEVKIEAQVREQMLKADTNIQMVPIWGSTLHHIDDLPYDPREYFPHTYGFMRKKQEGVRVRQLLPIPDDDSLPFIDVSKAPQLEKDAAQFMPDLVDDLGFTEQEVQVSAKQDKRICYKFKGGEEAGLARMNEYISGKRAVSKYATTRNDLIGANYSSKLSPWLANGSISCRRVYWEVKNFERQQTKNESTTVYVDELFWRDFNRYWCLYHGNKIFSSYGIYDRTYYNWQTDLTTVDRWRQGLTGMPFIDALMRDMNTTGFMPNRGRMVVSCYFAMDLKQDWRHGAHWFEQQLIDHDVQSNYGGWCGSCGIGPGRVLVFNSLTQSQKFDADGRYIRMWCPELENVPSEYIHDPWNMPSTLKKKLKVQIGGEKSMDESIAWYPEPINCTKYTSPEAAKKMKRKPSAKQTTLGQFAAKSKQ